MFAVVKTGGKQYRVAQGDKITVEKIEGEIGTEVELSDIVMTSDGVSIVVDADTLSRKAVKARIIAQGKGKKILIWKHRRRKDSRQKMGHRQKLTQLEIVTIG
jgi:large subunit ribosomal protein L21